MLDDFERKDAVCVGAGLFGLINVSYRAGHPLLVVSSSFPAALLLKEHCKLNVAARPISCELDVLCAVCRVL